MKPSDVQKTRRQHLWSEKNVPISLRPVRLIQLIVDIILLSLTVNLWTRSNIHMGTVIALTLIILFASFAILMGIDSVGQIGGCLTPDLPMFLIAFLGLVLFISAAQVVYLLVETHNGSTLVIILLCLVAALLFLLDATMMIMFWRFTYVKKDRCLPCISGKSLTVVNSHIITSEAHDEPSEAHDELSEPPQSRFHQSNPVTRDVSTSVSRQSTTSFYSGLFSPRSNNRVGIEYRRQYVDAQTDPYSNTSLNLQVETQTQKVESAELVDHGTSAAAVIEEKPVQTLSECPVCSAALDRSPEGICPSFLSLFQSFGMSSCERNTRSKPATVCLVERGTLPDSNSSFETTESTIVVTKKPPRVYETRPCPTHGAGLRAQRAGLSNPVTKVCLPHFIKKNKKTQTPVSKPLAMRDEYQNTETDEKTSESEEPVAFEKDGAQESSTSVENAALNDELVKRENSTIESITSTGNSPTERSSVLAKNKNAVKESEERSFPSIAQRMFIMQRSSDDLSIPKRENYPLASTIDPERVSETEEKSSIVSSSFEKTLNLTSENVTEKSSKIESITSTGTSPISLLEPTLRNTSIHPPETSKNNADLRELRSPNVVCQCPQYYYKDVFGRYICGKCSHKHLIKIPQQLPVTPVRDMRCCSCSQAIIYQMPNAEQKTCGTNCKCKYQTPRSSK